MKHGELTKQKILDAGVGIWPDISLSSIARACGFKSHRTVSYHFPVDKLKDAVAAHAVENGNAKIILELLAVDHKAVRKLSQADRKKYLNKIYKTARTKS